MRNLIYRGAAAMSLLIASAAPAFTQADSPLHPVQFSTEVRHSISGGYLVYLPEDYDKSQHWPLVVFLHGSGERGEDLEKVKKHGPPKLAEAGKQFPFILVAPQCPADEWWPTEFLDAVMEDVFERYAVDPDRVYLTGLSMGGYGTWSYALRRPHLFAAIAPICGGGTPWIACRIAHVPVWAFHGALDRVVPVSESVKMVDALRACGGDVRFTVYPDAAHDSFTETYENDELYDWLLSRRRENP